MRRFLAFTSILMVAIVAACWLITSPRPASTDHDRMAADLGRAGSPASVEASAELPDHAADRTTDAATGAGSQDAAPATVPVDDTPIAHRRELGLDDFRAAKRDAWPTVRADGLPVAPGLRADDRFQRGVEELDAAGVRQRRTWIVHRPDFKHPLIRVVEQADGQVHETVADHLIVRPAAGIDLRRRAGRSGSATALRGAPGHAAVARGRGRRSGGRWPASGPRPHDPHGAGQRRMTRLRVPRHRHVIHRLARGTWRPSERWGFHQGPVRPVRK